MPRWNDTPMVGRAGELAALLVHVDRAVEGRPSAVLLSGDAGVGKTRLLDELAARAAERGVRVLTGHCVDLGDVGLPYLPFVDLLRPVAADPGLAPTTAALPAFTDLLGGSAAAPRPDAAAALPDRSLRPALDDGRLQLFESVALLLGELTAAAPLLVVIEDLHWADRSSRDLLRYLLARLVDEPVAVVVSYRSDDLHRRHPLRPLLAELLRLPSVAHLDLRQLPDPAIAELVRNLTGSSTAEAAAVGRVVARAEGNAFYAEELVAAGPEGDSLPGALADLLLARVERVGPQAQQVLRAAAVAGRRVRHDLLAAVSGLPAVELDRALTEAVGHHLLVSDGHRYRFRHALLREAVLADLLPGERVRLHAAVAAYLRDDPAAGTAAERAHHARESNDLPGAFTATLEAAEEARRGGAPAEQLQQLEAALALWDAVPGAAERAGRAHAELLLETALAARAGGDVHGAVALLRSARDALADCGDPLFRARVHYTLAVAFIWLDDFEAAYAESSAALALVPAQPPSPARTWAAATHARTAHYMGARTESDAAAEEALRAADVLGLDAAWADTAASLARIPNGEDAAAVRARLEEALVRARRSGDVDVEMRVLFNLAIDAYESGDLAATVGWSRTAVDEACAAGVEWSFYPAELRHLVVVAGYMTGDWAAALAAAEQLARVPDMAAHVRAAGLLVHVGRGDADAAERISWARGLSERLSSPVMLMVTAAAAEVELAGWTGDAEAAVRRAVEASRRLGELWPVDRLATVRLVALALSAAADAAAEARLRGEGGKVAHWTEAADSLTALAAEAEAAYRAGGGPIGPEGRAWRGRLEAEAARLAGDPAPERWRASVEDFDRLGHVYEQARSRWRLAEALLAVDERAEAAAHLREAQAAATRLGAVPLREAVQALARRARLGAELSGGRDPDVSGVLTPREAEVLALLAQGRTNRQIGAALYISEKTASVHVSNILAKLSAGGRTEAVAIAAQRGLLPSVGARPA